MYEWNCSLTDRHPQFFVELQFCGKIQWRHANAANIKGHLEYLRSQGSERNKTRRTHDKTALVWFYLWHHSQDLVDVVTITHEKAALVWFYLWQYSQILVDVVCSYWGSEISKQYLMTDTRGSVYKKAAYHTTRSPILFLFANKCSKATLLKMIEGDYIPLYCYGEKTCSYLLTWALCYSNENCLN